MRWWKEWIDSFNNVVELPDPLITELHSKGYSYDEEKEWWVRVWSTDTPVSYTHLTLPTILRV